MADLYKSERWLRRRYLVDRKTPEQIGEEVGVSHMRPAVSLPDLA